MAGWTLKVLKANILGDGEQVSSPDRKTAGLLTYLALEGPTSRRKLAGLLWPEVEEAKARNSLARVLSRLRKASHPQIVVGGDVLRLNDALEVDVARLKVLAFQSDWVALLDLAGELLPHFEYDDSSEFADWLHSERSSVVELTAQALQARIRELEQRGRYQEAIDLGGRLIDLDPMLEAPYRLIMRLHHLNGDRAAALKAFTEVRGMLLREWGAEPSQETRAMAERIERGDEGRGLRGAGPDPVARTRLAMTMPVSVAKALPLVGREREWALMEEAWQRGHAIMLHGPPGVGKTRLMMDFAASKGTVFLTAGRPGDAAVPQLSLARGLRRAFSERRDLRLPDWVRGELTTLIPELAGDTPASHAPRDLSTTLRFEEALSRFYDAMLEVFDVVVVDDLQFYDTVSFEAASRFVNRLPAEGASARTICAFRSDEVPPSYLRHMEDLSGRGLHTIIRLQPLAPEATGRLLAQVVSGCSVDVADVERLATDLHRYTGGNPLFILETVKHLLEREQLGGAFPDRLPPMDRVGAVIHQRFSRLSQEAQRIAQAASVLQSDFDLEMIAALLEVKAAALLTPWRELEDAGFLATDRFSHDLIFEAVDQTVSQPVRAVLQRSAAGLRPERRPLRPGPSS